MNYKVKKGEFRTLEEMVKALDHLPRKHSTLLIGIDGCGGAGKSTLAKLVKEAYSNVTIVHIDDFYFPKDQIIQSHPTQKPIGADLDWQRVFAQVIEPLTKEQSGYYQRYDWDLDQLAEWHTVPTGGIVIIEGVYSTRNELQTYYDLTIWVDCPREIRLKRGIDRDGEGARQIWENNWMVAEEMYMNEHKPQDRAKLVLE